MPHCPEENPFSEAHVGQGRLTTADLGWLWEDAGDTACPTPPPAAEYPGEELTHLGLEAGRKAVSRQERRTTTLFGEVLQGRPVYPKDGNCFVFV